MRNTFQESEATMYPCLKTRSSRVSGRTPSSMENSESRELSVTVLSLPPEILGDAPAASAAVREPTAGGHELKKDTFMGIN